MFYSMAMSIAAISAAGLSLSFVEAFQPLSRTRSNIGIGIGRQQLPSPHKSSSPPLTVMFRIRCENKYYQLEELEDAENCTTELFLKENGIVEIGATDGPLFTEAVGNWEIKDNRFAMTVTKTFASGHSNNDMGEFEFKVERVFEGDMTVVGGTEVAVNGKIFAQDIITDKMEQEVGFFNMIDGTDQRLERRADARPKDIGVKPSPIDSNDVKGHDGIPKEWLAQPMIDPALSAYGQQQQQEQQQEQEQLQQQQQQQQQQQGLPEYGGGNFGQDAQGYGGSTGAAGYGQQQQQQPPQQQQQGYDGGGNGSNTGGGLPEYGGGNFGQESQGYGGGGYGQPQQQQPTNDPGPPSFADYGQQPQQQQPTNDPGPPSFADYGQQPQQQQPTNDPGPPSFADYGQPQQQQSQSPPPPPPQQQQQQQQGGYGNNAYNDYYNSEQQQQQQQPPPPPPPPPQTDDNNGGYNDYYSPEQQQQQQDGGGNNNNGGSGGLSPMGGGGSASPWP